MARKPDLLPTTRADSPRLRTVALNERDLIYSDDYVEGRVAGLPGRAGAARLAITRCASPRRHTRRRRGASQP